MSRSTFGGSAADAVWSESQGPGYKLLVSVVNTPVTMWSAASGGTQYTDLLLGGVGVTTIPAGTAGFLPSFQGPDGITVIYADAGGGTRVKLPASQKTVPGGFTYPFVIPHRGAGQYAFPQGNLVAYRIGSESFDNLDGGDLRMMADGSFVDYHDTTLDTVTTSYGNVWTLSTSAQFRILSYKDISSFPVGSLATLRPLTWNDLARDYGGKKILWPEIKWDGTPPWAAGVQGTAFAKLLVSQGLTQSVILGSFFLAELTPALAVGVTCAWYPIGDASTGANHTDATAAYAAGVRHVVITATGGVSAPSSVAFYTGLGFTVGVATLEHQYDYAQWIAAGASYIYSEAPLYVDGKPANYRMTADSFGSGTFPPGMLAADGSAAGRGTIVNGRWWPPLNAEPALLGQFSPVANPAGTYTLGLTVCFEVIGSDVTRHADIVVAAADDRMFQSDVPQAYTNGYIVGVRPDALNQLQVWEVVGGVVTSKANQGPQGVVVTSAILTSGVAITAIPVVATTAFIASGSKYLLPTGQQATLSAQANVGATSLAVTSITPSATVASGSSLPAVLKIVAPLVTTSTLAAGVAITSIAVSALPAAIASGSKFALPTLGTDGKPQFAVLSANAASGATSVTVTSVTPSAAVASGSSLPQAADITIQVTPTQVIATRTDTALSATATAAAVRGGYLNAGQNNSLGVSGMRVSYSKMTVT